MCALRTPLVSFHASGKLADTIVYHNWKNISDAHEYTIPANPQTTDQQTNRERFTVSDRFYCAMEQLPQIISGWKDSARRSREKMSGYNMFMRHSLKLLQHVSDPQMVTELVQLNDTDVLFKTLGLRSETTGTEAGDFKIYTGVNSKTLKFVTAQPYSPVHNGVRVINYGNVGDIVLGQVVKTGFFRSGVVKTIMQPP